ncbi:MAG TPA: Maf family protein, partial [Planctomycetaceae bacterium]|nr:Maf family protein [Planctomycetaceae bacterium]
MSRRDTRLVLGSRSPRRLELLRQIWPAEQIDVVPPSSIAEAHFENLHDWQSIERRLLEIAVAKCGDVAAQVRSRLNDAGTLSPLSPCGRGVGGEGAFGHYESSVVIAADTVVIVDRGGLLHVLGQPPDDDSWREAVRRWFREDYAGKTHLAVTALCLERLHSNGSQEARRMTRVVTSRVTFVEDVDRWLDWYLSTEEPRGKAGGYALQGAGSIFIA